jgi:hypothetical protein
MRVREPSIMRRERAIVARCAVARVAGVMMAIYSRAGREVWNDGLMVSDPLSTIDRASGVRRLRTDPRCPSDVRIEWRQTDIR